MRFLQAVTDAAQVGDTLVGDVTEVCTQPVEAVPEAAIMEPVQYGGAAHTFSFIVMFIVMLGVIVILILFGILIVKLWKQGNKVEHLERKVDSHLMTQQQYQQYQQHQEYIQHLRQNQAMGSQHQDDGTNNMPNG